MIDLGNVHLITDRPGATPAPTHTNPSGPSQLDDRDRDNAAKLGRLQYLLGEMQHIAGRDGCPADLADLIDQARQVTDLRSAA